NDHARDPEENNIRSGDKDRCRIKFLSGFSVHRFVSPKPRRKPGIECVFVLPPTFARRIDLHASFTIAVPRRYSVSPPNLSADAPVLNIREPLRINFLPMLREEANEMLFYDRERFFRLRITQKPLFAQPWLDRHFTAIAETDIIFILISLRQ